MEYIKNISGISIDIYAIRQSETENTGAAVGGTPMRRLLHGRPIGSVFFVSVHFFIV